MPSIINIMNKWNSLHSSYYSFVVKKDNLFMSNSKQHEREERTKWKGSDIKDVFNDSKKKLITSYTEKIAINKMMHENKT